MAEKVKEEVGQIIQVLIVTLKALIKNEIDIEHEKSFRLPGRSNCIDVVWAWVLWLLAPTPRVSRSWGHARPGTLMFLGPFFFEDSRCPGTVYLLVAFLLLGIPSWDIALSRERGLRNLLPFRGDHYLNYKIRYGYPRPILTTRSHFRGFDNYILIVVSFILYNP